MSRKFILAMNFLDIMTYAEKDALEDLTPYLEGSGHKKEDYLESVIEEFTIGGRLVSIPTRFSIYLYSGRASQVWETPGYTMEDLMELTEEYAHSQTVHFAYGAADCLNEIQPAVRSGAS